MPDGECVQMIVCHGDVNKIVRKKKRCYFGVAGSRFMIVVFDFDRGMTNRELLIIIVFDTSLPLHVYRERRVDAGA